MEARSCKWLQAVRRLLEAIGVSTLSWCLNQRWSRERWCHPRWKWRQNEACQDNGTRTKHQKQTGRHSGLLLDCTPWKAREANDQQRRSPCTFPNCRTQHSYRAHADTEQQSCTKKELSKLDRFFFVNDCCSVCAWALTPTTLTFDVTQGSKGHRKCPTFRILWIEELPLHGWSLGQRHSASHESHKHALPFDGTSRMAPSTTPKHRDCAKHHQRLTSRRAGRVWSAQWEKGNCPRKASCCRTKWHLLTLRHWPRPTGCDWGWSSYNAFWVHNLSQICKLKKLYICIHKIRSLQKIFCV